MRDLPSPADEELMRRIALGDQEAFACVYRRHQLTVYRFARHMCGSPHMAEDITQETFVILLRNAHRYRPERAVVSTYLYGIARNLTRQRHRRERLIVSIDAEASEGALLPLATENHPYDALSRTQTTALLQRMLLALPPHYREVIVLCDLQGLDYAEAARVVESAVGTVRSRLNRGRKMLAKRLRSRDCDDTITQQQRGCIRLEDF